MFGKNGSVIRCEENVRSPMARAMMHEVREQETLSYFHVPRPFPR